MHQISHGLLPIHCQLELVAPRWVEVCRFSHRTELVKGRKNQHYKSARIAALAISALYGCYSWATDTQVFYCGSFSPYAKGHGSSLAGRVHNYLQNHRFKTNGMSQNTNLRVFTAINNALVEGDVKLQWLNFDHLMFCGERISYTGFSTESRWVRAVEELLIASYRHIHECQWNQT